MWHRGSARGCGGQGHRARVVGPRSEASPEYMPALNGQARDQACAGARHAWASSDSRIAVPKPDVYPGRTWERGMPVTAEET